MKYAPPQKQSQRQQKWQISLFRTLEIKQRLVTLQEELIQEKQHPFSEVLVFSLALLLCSSPPSPHESLANQQRHHRRSEGWQLHHHRTRKNWIRAPHAPSSVNCQYLTHLRTLWKPLLSEFSLFDLTQK